MQGAASPPLTDINRAEVTGPEFPASRLLVFLLPVIVVAAATAALAAAAVAVGFRREEMMAIAAVAGVGAALPAIVLVYLLRAERSAADLSARHFAARTGEMVESAMDAIITVDAAQRVVQFNAAAELAFRWPRKAILGQPLDLLLPERFRGVHRQHVERFGLGAETSRGMGAQRVLRGLRADGVEFPIEASISRHDGEGGPLFTVILRDVTARVQSEEQLARSEARLRGILDSAMDAIITIDERHHIVLFNAAAEAVFGCPRDQAIGAPLEWFIPERFRAGHAAHVKRFGETGVSSRRMGAQRIVMGLRRNGEEFPIDASISQISEGGQRYYTVILRDVTERWLADEELRASREEIRELALSASSAREQEKSRVARELHDELGQSLTALKIDVAWLRDNLADAPLATGAKLSAMQLMIDGTVAAARRIASDLRPLMLDDLGLVPACDWLAGNFRRRTGVACELVIGEGDLELPDPYATAVFRVLQESLTNVAKHSNATQVEVTLERLAGEVVLTVGDNGQGFATGAPRKPGSHGLTGLRERAALLDGSVSIDSAPGRGTVIEMRLPTKALEPTP